MKNITKEKIFSIIKQETNIDISNIDPKRDLQEQVSFDSMQFVSITSRVENELKIELPISVMEISTLNEFLDIIEKEL